MNKKKFIIENIDKLNKNQKEELISVIKTNDIIYMENNNGIFVSLNNVSEAIIDKLIEHVQYCLEHKIKTETPNSFNLDSLIYINEFLNKNNIEKVPDPIIERKIMKEIIPKKKLDISKITISKLQEHIISNSKVFKIESS